jgi:hypothetical protein
MVQSLVAFLHFAAVYLSISGLFHNDSMVDGGTLISTLVEYMVHTALLKY